MKSRVLSTAQAPTLGSSFRKQGPLVALGLGGLFTILWIVLISWIPMQLIVWAISLAVTDLLQSNI